MVYHFVMSTLLSISREHLSALYPRTLYEFAQHLNSYNSDFFIDQDSELAKVDPKIGDFDDNQDDLKQRLQDYRESMMAAIRKVEINNASSEANVAVLVLLHDLRKCATEELVDELSNRSSVCYSSGIPDFEYVVRVLLKEKKQNAKELIRTVVQKANRRISRGFNYYTIKPGDFKLNEELKPGHGLEEALADEIRNQVQEKYDTEICIVRIEEVGEKWHIEIIHGGKKQRTETEKKAKAADALIQPLETDTIVYNTRTKDIKVHMAKRMVRTERDVYVVALGKCLSNQLRLWESVAKFDLERFRVKKEELQELLDSGSKYLSSPELGNVQVLLTEVGYSEIVETDSKKHVSVDRKKTCTSDGLCCTLKPGEPLLEATYTIDYVILSVRYGVAKPRKLRVVIKPQTLSECPIASVEYWLEEIGVGQVPDELSKK